MYFVHPQIKLNNAVKAVLSLIKPLNQDQLARRLSVYFPGKQFIFTDMGRSAFKVIAEKLNLHDSEILFPAYICDIFYPIFRQYHIKPIFLDIDLNTFHIKAEEIKKKITPQTKAIFICHTYGLESGLPRSSGLAIIEDCAHAFGIKPKSDAAFFSIYKQFPTLRGGMVVCPKDWQVELPGTKFNFRDFLSFLNYFWPVAFFFKKFGSEYARAHQREEKFYEPAGINRQSLGLFSDFLEDTEQSLENRKRLALFFQEELQKLGFEVQEPRNNVFCYLSALVPAHLTEKRDEIVHGLYKYRIFCTRIWHAPIILNPEVQKEYNINLADFPNTVEAAKRIINFPLQNHYTQKDIAKIIEAIKKVL